MKKPIIHILLLLLIPVIVLYSTDSSAAYTYNVGALLPGDTTLTLNSGADGGVDNFPAILRNGDPAKVGIILLHGRGENVSDGHVILPLRQDLSTLGYTTLSIDTPVPKNLVPGTFSYYDYLNFRAEAYSIFPETDARIRTASRYLQSLGINKAILIGFSLGSRLSSASMRYGAAGVIPIVGHAGIGMGSDTVVSLLDTPTSIAGITTPMLDLYGSLEDVLNASLRSAAYKGPAYTQIMQQGAAHQWEGFEAQLISYVASFVNTLNAGTSATTATVGSAFNFSATAGAASGFGISSTLPGLSFNTSTGVLSGTPTAAGISGITISATYADGSTSSQYLTITVNAPLSTIITGSGTVHSTTTPSTPDINCSTACTQLYVGDIVTMTATPATGFGFTGWGGACSGSGSCSVTMSQAQSVTALFTQLSYSVTASVSGGTGGSITPTGSTVNYGGPVTFTITPTSGYTLGSLTDNGTLVTATAAANGSSTYTITNVTANHTLQATFLTANIDPAGSGNQYAWSENRGWINFKPGYGPGVSVTATAVTGMAWGENLGWIDLAPAYGGVTNDGIGNLSGYAWSENGGWIDFQPTGGGVTIGSDGSFSGYAWGENIGWISFNVPNVGVKSSWLIPYQLDVMVTGSGTVNSSTNPVTTDINCSGACTQAYNSGSMVTLTATPATGFSFTGWGGACGGSGSCSVTMSQAWSVTALFTQLSYTVTASVSGGTGGSITPVSSSANYGSPVTFTITPTSGYTLSSLTDNGTAVTATAEANGSYTYTITSVTANQSLQATFSPVVVPPTPVPALNPLSLVVAALGLGGILVRRKRTSTQNENG
jgi:predicted esterase